MFRRVVGVLVLAAAAAAWGQRFGIEIKGGRYAGGWFEDVAGRESAVDDSWRKTFGAAVQLDLTERFAVEVTGLYRSVRRTGSTGYSFAGSTFLEHGRSWEIPLVAKYVLRRNLRGFHPFVVAGPSVRWLGTALDTFTLTLVPGPIGPTTVGSWGTRRISDWDAGLGTGGGLERRVGPVRVTFDARYTYWPQTGSSDPSGCLVRCLDHHQFLALFGFGF